MTYVWKTYFRKFVICIGSRRSAVQYISLRNFMHYFVILFHKVGISHLLFKFKQAERSFPKKRNYFIPSKSFPVLYMQCMNTVSGALLICPYSVQECWFFCLFYPFNCIFSFLIYVGGSSCALIHILKTLHFSNVNEQKPNS